MLETFLGPDVLLKSTYVILGSDGDDKNIIQ